MSDEKGIVVSQTSHLLRAERSNTVLYRLG